MFGAFCWDQCMKSFFPIIALISLLSTNVSFAGSATWRPHPTSDDWNNAANWRPKTIPNGPNDTATFGASDITDVSLTAAETELDGIVFAPGANAFTITPVHDNTVAFMGFGIENNSGVTQNFVTTTLVFVGYGLSFHNQATAGTQTVFTVANYGSAFGSIGFYDQASAAFATFIIDGTEFFEDGSPYIAFLQN